MIPSEKFRFLFFADLVGKKVVAADGSTLGRLTDLVAFTGEPYPPVESLVVRSGLFPTALTSSPAERAGDLRRALRIKPRIWRSESAKGACRWWWALRRLGLGAPRLSMAP